MKKYTLEKKMRSSFILAFTCILVVIIAAMSWIVRGVYRDNSYRTYEELVRLNLSLLNRQVMEIQQTQDVVGKNAAVRDAMAYYAHRDDRDYLEELNYQRKLDEVFYTLERSDAICNAYLVDVQGSCVYEYIRSLKVGHDMRTEPWYAELTERIRMNTCYISGVHDRSYLVTENEGECISMVLPVQQPSGYRFRPDGYLVCDVSLEHVLYGSDGGSDMRFALMDGNGYLYADAAKLTGREAQAVAAAMQESEEELQVCLLRTGWLQERLLVSIRSRLYGWRVIGIKDLTELQAMDRLLFGLFLLLALAAVAVIVLLSRRIARSILNPMNRLIAACNQVSSGNYAVEFPEAQSEEIAILTQTVEDMVQSVGRLTGQLLAEEKALSQEKMKVLQHQINPHFLNNVLQAIKAMAVEGETEKISRIVTLLGRFLAYSVYRPYEGVRLEEELAYLRTYLEIQNIRYHDAILFSVSCEEELRGLIIPKLTLQPVVENAIEHGYEGRGRLLLDVSAERDEELAEICIHDNGRGIAPEELQRIRGQLLRGETYRAGRSIGIVNVNERLKKQYGAAYGITLNSHEGSGTTVILRLPYTPPGKAGSACKAEDSGKAESACKAEDSGRTESACEAENSGKAESACKAEGSDHAGSICGEGGSGRAGNICETEDSGRAQEGGGA